MEPRMATAAQLCNEYKDKRVMVTIMDHGPTMGADGTVTQEACAGLQVAGVARDIKVAYGRIFVLIEAVCGVGSAWCGEHRVTVVDAWPEPLTNVLPKEEVAPSAR